MAIRTLSLMPGTPRPERDRHDPDEKQQPDRRHRWQRTRQQERRGSRTCPPAGHYPAPRRHQEWQTSRQQTRPLSDCRGAAHQGFPFGSCCNWPTRASLSGPGLEVTPSLAGTSTCSPVRGLRALLGFRFLTSKTPKLRSSIRPSCTSVSVMPSKTRWTISLAWVWVRPISSAIPWAMTFLVMIFPASPLLSAQPPHVDEVLD